jgi:hypothetical protein
MNREFRVVTYNVRDFEEIGASCVTWAEQDLADNGSR